MQSLMTASVLLVFLGMSLISFGETLPSSIRNELSSIKKELSQLKDSRIPYTKYQAVAQSLDGVLLKFDALQEHAAEEISFLYAGQAVDVSIEGAKRITFIFLMTEDSNVTIETYGNVDTKLILKDSSGYIIKQDDNSGESYNARIKADLKKGRYFVEVYGSNGAQGASTLYASTSSGGSTIGVGESLQGNLDLGGYMKYSFRAPYSDYYVFETSGNTDTFMLLYSTNQKFAFDDDSGYGNNARIRTYLNSGNYFLEVRGYSSNVQGQYTVSVKR